MSMQKTRLMPALAALALVAAAPATQPTPQELVNRLVQEPWRFSGTSQNLARFGQAIAWKGEKPARILIGLAPQGDRLTGEIVALDAQNHPLAAAPLSGHFTETASSGQTSAACTLRAETAMPVTLRGICGAKVLAGAYTRDEAPTPLIVIAPGLAEPPVTEGDYWLEPWRS